MDPKSQVEALVAVEESPYTRAVAGSNLVVTCCLVIVPTSPPSPTSGEKWMMCPMDDPSAGSSVAPWGFDALQLSDWVRGDRLMQDGLLA